MSKLDAITDMVLAHNLNDGCYENLPATLDCSAVRVVLYYDAANGFNVFRREEPYPFRRLYAVGQGFVLDSIGWSVLNAWIGQGQVYHVICAQKMPGYLADMLRDSCKPNTQDQP